MAALNDAPTRAPDDPTADARILAAVATGDMSALGQLYDRYDDEVRRVVARLGVRPGDVDDLVQQTFLDVLQCAGRFDGRASARPWIVGVACMRVRRHRRSIGRLAARITAWALEPRVAHERSPEELAELGQRAVLAERALGQLSPKKRDAFVLVVLEGMSGEDAARALGVPSPTVGTRVHHARKEIRDFLAREGAQAEGSER